MKVRIYIPTRGRVGINKQVTLREFLSYSTHNPVLVCPPDEASHHRKYASSVWPCSREGIGCTRQWILEHSKFDVVIMADDDMRFSYRPDPGNIKLERCFNLDPMISLIKDYVRMGFIHGGIGARQGNNCKNCSTARKGVIENNHIFVDCERVNNFHFMNRSKVLEAGARMDALPVMEDIHFTLTLLTRGYPNRVIHDYVWHQKGSGLVGGCSLYRTENVQTEGAEGLASVFPDFVRVVDKRSKSTSSSWQQFKTRKDVVVQWAKAARYGGISLKEGSQSVARTQ